MSRYLNSRTRNIVQYVPGEQPQIAGLIKLNTNENPYPPSPKAVAAAREAASDRLRLYPPPNADALRDVVAARHGMARENVFCGNGSDEVLAFCFMAFFGDKPLRYPDITYGLYRAYVQVFGVKSDIIELRDDLTLPYQRFFGAEGGVIFPNPNAPTGLAIPLCAVEEIAANCRGCAVVVDEAYVEFGAESADSLIRKYDNIVIARTLSKSHALAGIRVGYALGSPELIAGLFKVKDCFNSYPLDSIAQRTAAAALADEEYYRKQNGKIIAVREKTKKELTSLGFTVPDSKANFLFVIHDKLGAKEAQQKLREAGILVRHFDEPRISDYLRITIGTEEQMEKLISAFRSML
ncbi:MAG: histidinol-phosphate transaminase [Bacillota bacterium]|nr:histidinol-phosphate transaminase [Bacillota bacterium]